MGLLCFIHICGRIRIFCHGPRYCYHCRHVARDCCRHRDSQIAGVETAVVVVFRVEKNSGAFPSAGFQTDAAEAVAVAVFRAEKWLPTLHLPVLELTRLRLGLLLLLLLLSICWGLLKRLSFPHFSAVLNRLVIVSPLKQVTPLFSLIGLRWFDCGCAGAFQNSFCPACYHWKADYYSCQNLPFYPCFCCHYFAADHSVCRKYSCVQRGRYCCYFQAGHYHFFFQLIIVPVRQVITIFSENCHYLFSQNHYCFVRGFCHIVQNSWWKRRLLFRSTLGLYTDTSFPLNCARPGPDASRKRTGLIRPAYLSASIRRGPPLTEYVTPAIVVINDSCTVDDRYVSAAINTIVPNSRRCNHSCVVQNHQ